MQKNNYISWKYGENEKYNPLTNLFELYPKKIQNFIAINPNVKLTYILAHPHFNWDWVQISENPSITIEDILTHPELPWNWEAISRNPNITLTYILAHPEKKWCYASLSKRLNFKEILKKSLYPLELGFCFTKSNYKNTGCFRAFRVSLELVLAFSKF
jgi:hypothetical protein